MPRAAAHSTMKHFLTACYLLTTLLHAEDPAGLPETVSYYEHVRPVFQAKCQGCHQPAKAKSDYIMTDVAALIAGGETDKAVIPGKAHESYLYELIVAQEGDDRPEMPPGKLPSPTTKRNLSENGSIKVPRTILPRTPGSATLRTILPVTLSPRSSHHSTIPLMANCWPSPVSTKF